MGRRPTVLTHLFRWNKVKVHDGGKKWKCCTSNLNWINPPQQQLCPSRLANVSYFSQWQLHVSNRVKLVFHTSSFITFCSVLLPHGNHLFLIAPLFLRVMLAKGKVRLGVLQTHVDACVSRGKVLVWGRIFPDLRPGWRGSIIMQKNAFAFFLNLAPGYQYLHVILGYRWSAVQSL